MSPPVAAHGIPEPLLGTVVQRLNDMLIITEAEPRFRPGPRIVFVNDAFVRHTGYTRDEVLGRSPAFLQGPDTDPEAVRRIGQAMAAWQPIRVEAVNYKKSGEPYWVEMDIVPVADDTGWFTHWVSVERDITGRREAERLLRERGEALDALIRHTQDAILTTDSEGRIVSLNPAAEALLGLSASDAVGRPLSHHLVSGWRGRSMPPGDDPDLVARPSSRPRRVRGLRSDGTLLDLEITITEVQVNGRWTATVFLRDVTERTRSERALVQYQLELSSLTQRLLEQEKQLSSRMAQALHDQLGQTLTALQLSFDLVRTLIEAPPAALERQLHRMQTLIQTAVGEVRTALMDLRPPQLDEFGLFAALSNEIATRQDGAQTVPVELHAPPNLREQRWPRDVEYALFMIARESLANALQHARASHIDLVLDECEGELILSIEDDGIGMTREDHVPRAGHLGLVGIRERAHAINARLSIEPAPHGGTDIRVTWRSA